MHVTKFYFIQLVLRIKYFEFEDMCQAIQSKQPKSPSSWNLGRITFGVCESNLVIGLYF